MDNPMLEDHGSSLHESMDRHWSYKQLIIQIADSLSQAHVEKIVYLYELPDKMKQDSPLHVLDHLHQMRGSEFNERNLTPLTNLLKNISKEDLVSTKVEPYKKKYFYWRPLASSMPTEAVNPRLPLKIRSSSYHAGQKSRSTPEFSVFEGQPVQETSLGTLASIPDHGSKIGEVDPRLETLSIRSDSHSAISVQLPPTDPEQSSKCTTQMSSEVEQTHHHQQGMVNGSVHHLHQGIRPPQNCSTSYGHYSSQSLPRHGHDSGIRYSLSYVELPQGSHGRDSRLQHQQAAGGHLLPRPQSVAAFNTPTVQERRSLQPRVPQSSSQWYQNNSSADSMLDHHGSYSSGFASSCEMLHHSGFHSYPRRQRLPPKPNLPAIPQYVDPQPPLDSRWLSREDCLNQYQPYPYSREQTLLCSGSYDPYTQDQDVYKTPHPHREELSRRPKRLNETGIQTPPSETTHPFDHNTSLGRKKKTTASPTADQELKSDSRNKRTLEKVSTDELKPEERQRSKSLDQKQAKAKKKASRSLLHLEQTSNGTLSPTDSRGSKELQFYSLRCDMTSSSSGSSPAHNSSNSESSKKFRTPLESSLVMSTHIPRSYHRHLLPRRTEHLRPQQELEWKVKMQNINKLIYTHKHVGKYLPCPTKVSVEGSGGLKVTLHLRLHPFGVEEDANRNVTFEVVIDPPKKLRLHSEAKLSLRVSAISEKNKIKLGIPREERRDANLSYFYIKGYISHEQLKEFERNENIIITVKAELIIPSGI